MRSLILITTIVAVLLCAWKADASDEQKVGSAMNDFGFGMFRYIWPEGKAVNYVISPLSVSLALSMTYNGAAGETKSEMAKVLGFSGNSDDEVNHLNSEWMERLQSADPLSTFNIANALWANQNIKFIPAFLKTNERFYKARVSNLDFGNAASAKQINDWVKAATKGKIPTLVEQIDPSSIMFLTNAIYFKGPWTHPFEKTATKPGDFTVVGGVKEKVPMMTRSGGMRYVETPDVQAVRLPYGNTSFAMYVVLPSRSGSLMGYIDRLSAQKWTALTNRMTMTDGELSMPRFRVEYKKDLRETLKGNGMRLAFDPAKADFSRMTDVEKVMINKVMHRTYVDVDEAGTEAAAATSVEIVPTSAPREPVKPFKMIVDRPFMFAIADENTGGLIFLGAVVDPKAE